ncbi:MAG: hypothetical protein R6U56_06465 [Opitutales bacterium]
MTNANNNPSAGQPSGFPPGLWGYVCTDPSGSVVEQEGQIAHSLDEYVAYFNQLGDLVADSLGFDSAEVIVFFGKKQNAICMEIDGLHYGGVFKPKSDRREVAEFFKEKGGDDDVFA